MARRETGAEGGTVAAALEAVEAAEETLRPLVDSVALDAMTSGDLRSALVRIDKVIVYVLVFPGRHDDRRAFRRYEAFSEGWLAHTAAVRRAARDGGSATPMVALLYFLGLDAHDGTLLVAYEGDDEHRYPKELSEVSGPLSRRQRRDQLDLQICPGMNRDAAEEPRCERRSILGSTSGRATRPSPCRMMPHLAFLPTAMAACSCPQPSTSERMAR